jgi:branched-chain amino acid transport system substrate-binding protein
MPTKKQQRRLVHTYGGTLIYFSYQTKPGINETFKYTKYFSMIPNGPTPKPAFTRGFFKVAEMQQPRPQTIALAYADAEFGQNACEGARENA